MLDDYGGRPRLDDGHGSADRPLRAFVGASASIPTVVPTELNLTGRVALVSGAGSPTGIGFATCRALGKLGAAVALTATTDRVADRVRELRGEGFTATGVTADLTDPAAAEKAVRAAVELGDRLDIVVNNAGMVSVSDNSAITGGVDGLPYDDWQHSLRRNLDTAFLLTRAAVPVMRANRWGRIVMVSSVTGAVMAMRRDAAYAAAKAAMAGLVRSLAVDLAAEGITANAIAPGWIATGSQTEDERRQGISTPAGRSGTAEEVAWPVAWLCTPAAAYLTGQLVTVDGGNSIAEERAPDR